MTDRVGPPSHLRSHFRLNFEQQQKRAKDLLRAARAGEPAALARFNSSSKPKLAEAQRLIAAELRFDSWASLKRHIAAMTAAHTRRGRITDEDLPGARAGPTWPGRIWIPPPGGSALGRR